MKINRWFDDVPGTLFFSFLGCVISGLCGLVSWTGLSLPLALLLNFWMGFGLAYLLLPIWGQICIAMFTIGGFFLTFGPLSFFAHRPFNAWVFIATTLVALVFIWGFAKGDNRVKREDKRDARGLEEASE